MKIWKRNAIVATVLVLVCAGVYLNWNTTRQEPIDLTETLSEEYLMNDSVSAEDGAVSVSSEQVATEDYFAQIRLSRQETRDNAVELLQETIAYEESGEVASTAVASLDNLVGDALAESQIESLVIAKGYEDCLAYMSDGTINVAVSTQPEGLEESDVALICDVVTAQTDYSLDEIRIIEVK